MKTVDPHQPLSGRVYAIIALAGLLVGIALLFFYVYQVPKLVESGAQNQVFYLLLIPWALSCAAFLFGTMRSYARFTQKQVGSTLELGGPVVLFCLVVAGGFKLVPQAAESFDLTVRAHSADGTVPLITSGKITLELENTLRAENIGSNGEANFKGIPPKFKGTTVRILPEVDGYTSKWQRHKLLRDVLDLPLDPATQSVTRLSGSILPPPTGWKNIRVLVDGQQAEGNVDDLGRFNFPVNGKDGDRVRLRVYAEAKLVYDGYQTLPGPVTLKLLPGTPNPAGSTRQAAGAKPLVEHPPVPDAKQVQQATTMGNFHFEKGEYDEAIRWYKNGLSLDPANADLKRLLRRAESAKASEAQ